MSNNTCYLCEEVINFEDYEDDYTIQENYEDYWRGFHEMCDELHDDEIYNSITSSAIVEKNKRMDLDNLEGISYFKHVRGLNVTSNDNYWFTSDEVEAFREIWLRRLSVA